jgi:hypothetical protein
MIILASSVVVLLLQMKRQNSELLALRAAAPDSDGPGNDDPEPAGTPEVTNGGLMALDHPVNSSAFDAAARRINEH